MVQYKDWFNFHTGNLRYLYWIRAQAQMIDPSSVVNGRILSIIMHLREVLNKINSNGCTYISCQHVIKPSSKLTHNCASYIYVYICIYMYVYIYINLCVCLCLCHRWSTLWTICAFQSLHQGVWNSTTQMTFGEVSIKSISLPFNYARTNVLQYHKTEFPNFLASKYLNISITLEDILIGNAVSRLQYRRTLAHGKLTRHMFTIMPNPCKCL